MQNTPKSMRLQIAFFGQTNAGKSTLLNLLAGQDVAITSPQPGTTTDVVEKAMELRPLGPVLFLDTAGLGDHTELGKERMERTLQVLNRTDLAVLVSTASSWGKIEEELLCQLFEKNIPFIIVINKTDQFQVNQTLSQKLESFPASQVLQISAADKTNRERTLNRFTEAVLQLCPEEFLSPPPLLGDLIVPNSKVILVTPIDLQAPKGRLILPQVQAIRDSLDHEAAALCVKENFYPSLLADLKTPPALVVCDSQVVKQTIASTPERIPCTTFSILFSRLKGDLILQAKGAAAIDQLQDGDKILIAEACSHHPSEDDIGRVKIPAWLKKYTGKNLFFEVCAGRDFPDNLHEYRLMIHCGGCMFNRKEILSRLQLAASAGIPVTNYGMCIAHTQGTLERVLSPLPEALAAYRSASNKCPQKN